MRLSSLSFVSPRGTTRHGIEKENPTPLQWSRISPLPRSPTWDPLPHYRLSITSRTNRGTEHHPGICSGSPVSANRRLASHAAKRADSRGAIPVAWTETQRSECPHSLRSLECAADGRELGFRGAEHRSSPLRICAGFSRCRHVSRKTSRQGLDDCSPFAPLTLELFTVSLFSSSPSRSDPVPTVTSWQLHAPAEVIAPCDARSSTPSGWAFTSYGLHRQAERPPFPGRPCSKWKRPPSSNRIERRD